MSLTRDAHTLSCLQLRGGLSPVDSFCLPSLLPVLLARVDRVYFSSCRMPTPRLGLGPASDGKQIGFGGSKMVQLNSRRVFQSWNRYNLWKHSPGFRFSVYQREEVVAATGQYLPDLLAHKLFPQNLPRFPDLPPYTDTGRIVFVHRTR